MRKWLIYSILGLSLVAQAQSTQALFDTANAAYQQERFDAAITAYTSILEQGEYSAAIYYNLGNSYFKAGQTAQAILNYERALQLAPRDEDIQNNLNLVNQTILDQFEELPQPLFRIGYLWVLRFFSPSAWGRLALLFILALLASTALYFYSSLRRLGFVGGTVSLLLAIACLVFAYAHQNYRETHREAIIMTASSYVKSAPSDQSDDLFILHEGTKAMVLDGFEGWKKIRLPDGKIGWIPEGDLEEV